MYLAIIIIALIVQVVFGLIGLSIAHDLAVWVFSLLAIQVTIPVVLAMLTLIFPPGSDALEMGGPLFLLLLYSVLIWIFILPSLFLCAKIFIRRLKLKDSQD